MESFKIQLYQFLQSLPPFSINKGSVKFYQTGPRTAATWFEKKTDKKFTQDELIFVFTAVKNLPVFGSNEKKNSESGSNFYLTFAAISSGAENWIFWRSLLSKTKTKKYQLARSLGWLSNSEKNGGYERFNFLDWCVRGITQLSQLRWILIFFSKIGFWKLINKNLNLIHWSNVFVAVIIFQS